MIEIDAAALRECVQFKGGNAKGIFIHGVTKSKNSAYVASLLRPGLQLMKIRKPQAKPFRVKNWTLEFTLDFIKDLTGPLVLLLESKPLEYLKLTAGCFGSSGDSFYVRYWYGPITLDSKSIRRANFDWFQAGMLSFERFEVIHIVNTKPSDPTQWEGCKIDPYDGRDASKPKEVPNMKYCLNPLFPNEIRRKERAQSEPGPIPSPDESKDMRVHQFSCKTSPTKSALVALVIGNENLLCRDGDASSSRRRYSIVKAVEQPKHLRRPCIILPQNVSEILSRQLISAGDPHKYCLPKTEIVTCNGKEIRSQLYSRDIVSFRSISDDTHEVLKTSSIRLANQGDKHCILNINDHCISIKEYLRLLQEEDIHPIILLLKGQTKKIPKMLLPNDRTKQGLFLQDVKAIEEQLKRIAWAFVPVNLDGCTKLEDAARIVVDKVADEMNRILWLEDDSDGILL